MYLTTGSYIKYGGMDGSNLERISTQFYATWGITVDIHSSTLYVADSSNNKIWSHRLDGRETKVVAEYSGTSKGIALVEQRLYWGLYYKNRVESIAMGGTGDTTSVYFGENGRIWGLTSPDWSLVANQINPCAGQTCSGVCVLTRTHYRCMARAV